MLRAAEAIDAAHVAVLVLDAIDGFTVEDKKIASRVMEAGRALLLVANKWDLVEDKDRLFKQLPRRRRCSARAHGDADLRRPRPGRRTGSRRCSSTCIEVDVAGADLDGQRDHPGRAAARPTPRRTGNLHYATQVATRPPTVRDLRGRPSRRVPATSATSRTGCARAPSRRRPDPPAVPGAARRPVAPRRAVGHGARPRLHCPRTGRGAAWLARLTGGQKVAGSNPAGPTDENERRSRRRPPRVLTVPNVISFARIALIPVFVCADRRTSDTTTAGSSCSRSSSRPTGSTARSRGGPAR